MKDNLNHQFNINSQNNVEILSIGTELLLGNIVDTNAKWSAVRLSILGINHYRQNTIGDNLNRICNVVKEISTRSKLLITTGGLGPTPDDLTTQAIAKAFGAKLIERKDLIKKLLRS